MPPLESEPDGHYGKWKMKIAIWGAQAASLLVSAACRNIRTTRAIPAQIRPRGGRRSVGAQNFGTRRRVSLQVQEQKGNAGSRFTRDPAFSRCAVSSSKD